LRYKNNSGNLRHVVYTLYTEQGFTPGQLADYIQCTAVDIKRLTRDGIVDDSLLERICSFFQIKKTPEFMRYVHAHAM
jgi:hypothetical protein